MGKGDTSMRDRVRQKAQEGGEGGKYDSGGRNLPYKLPTGKELFSPKKGISLIDIIPYKVSIKNHPDDIPAGDLWYRRKIFVHFGIGIEEKSYICPLKTPGIGKKCPICENRAQLLKDDPEGNKEVLAQLKPKQRELYNVINLEEEDKGVQLWDMSYHLFGKKLEEDLKTGDEDWVGFADLKSGFSLKIRFSAKTVGGFGFVEATRIDFQSREDYDKAVLDDTIDIDAMLDVLSYEELEKRLLGIEEQSGDEKKEQSTASKKRDEVEDAEKKEAAPASKYRRGGSAEKEEPAPDAKKEDKKEAAEPPRRVRRGAPEAEEACPKGHKWGKDNDTTDDCGKCPNDTWEKCSAEYEKMKKEK